MTIQELLKQLDVEFLESGHHHCRPGWIQLRRCPFCHSDNFHLGYSLSAQFFACWKCGGHSSFAVLLKFGLGKREIKDFIRGRKDLVTTPERIRGHLKEPEGRVKLLAQHKDYLRLRGFDPCELVRLWKIEGIGIATRLPWRIYIPILYNGQRVSWTTRSISPTAQQRYVAAGANEEIESSKHLIYGQEYITHRILVVEGPFDAWAVGPGTGALFGTAYSTAQLRKLSQIPYRYICFDSSSNAQAKAHELCDQLSCFPGVTENILLDAKDPAEASPKELRLLRKAAKL